MKTFICGHRNPDLDSVMSAYALADLRLRTGSVNVEPICVGRLPERAQWVFDHFHLKPLVARRDVYVRVHDLMTPELPRLVSTLPLVDALRQLAASGESSLPVMDEAGIFLGMLSPAKLLNMFIERADLSIPLGKTPLHHCALTLQADDAVHDIRSAAVKSSHNHFPVVDAEGHLLGTVLKRAFAEEPPFRMILVDHNETAQGIPGLDEVPVIEVVDHHRIQFAATKEPIRYTADVVGSTCTLVARLYRAAGERPVKEIAGVLLAGVIADTLLFQSPTTTETDRKMATWLEKLSGEKSEDLMAGILSVASPLASMTAEQAVGSDAKAYAENGFNFVLAQLEETNLALVHQHLKDLSAELERRMQADKLDFIALLITDPVRGNSELLYRGSEQVRRQLPYRRSDKGTFLLPGVLSRKKQLLPAIISALS